MPHRELQIFFENPKLFAPENIKGLAGIVGLYFIFTQNTKIQYPFRQSRLLYIGMSERRSNSIGNRLMGHFDGTSKNQGLSNYRLADDLYFTKINFEMIRSYWTHSIEKLESYFILDFVKKYGVYPICNNKSSFEILQVERDTEFIIDWEYFE